MKRKPHTPQEKADLVLETFRGKKTINEIASVNEIHPNMLSRWKREAETSPVPIEDAVSKRVLT